MPLISETLAQFVHQLRYENIPVPVRERAKDLMLDAIGIAFASTQFEFADKALAGLSFFGGGARAVIGMPASLALRDAVVMNGVLIHGLDYDDTHLEGVVHASASCFSCALGDKVTYEIDPMEEYPKYFSGEVIIPLNDGRELRHREHINRGAAERPIGREDIVTKYSDNAGMAIARGRAEKTRDTVYAADNVPARTLEAALAHQAN